MSKVKSNYEIISDKTQNPVVDSTYVKHGTGWLDTVINQATSALNTKADKTYVDTQIATKANSSDVSALQTTVQSKADSSTVSTLSGRVNDVETEQDTLSARMDTFTALEDGSTTGDAELKDARIGADGKTYTNAGGAIRGQITDLKSDISQLSIIYPYQNGNRIFVSKWEQGRYDTDSSTNVVRKNETDSPETKAIRIRTDIFKLENSARIDVAQGYTISIYRLDDNDVSKKYINWTTSFIIEKGYRYALVAKSESSSNPNIDYKNANNIITVTMLNNELISENFAKTSFDNSKNLTDEIQITGFKYTYGSFNITNYNSPIAINNTSAATHIRVRSDGMIKASGYIRLECDPGYTATLSLLDSNLNWKGDVDANGDGVATRYGFMVMARKSDNTEITLDEVYNHVRVYTKKYNTLSFESGGVTTNSSGYYTENNTEAGMTLRIRTTPTKINIPFRITAKNGYSFDFALYEKDETGYKKVYQEETYDHIGWIKETVHPAYNDVYVGITVKSDNGSNIYPYRINQYLEFEYDYANKCIGDVAKKYEGLKALYIGDSITEVNYSAPCNWTKLVTSWFGFIPTNIAAGGTGIVRGGTNAWNTKIDNIEGEFDIILIMGNMNDYSGNVFNESKLGQFGDTGLNTQYGAVNTFLKKVLDKWPLAKIGWITSTPRQYLSGDPDNPDPVVSAGYLWSKTGVFENADKAIIEVCHNYSVPVLDMFHESNLQAWSATQRADFFYNDGNSVHPNDKGHMIMAVKIADFIKKNF